MAKTNTMKMEMISFGRGFDILALDHKVEVDEHGIAWMIVNRGATIRTWGTSHGLAQLGVMGPTSKTILDAIPHGLKIPVASIHCVWNLSAESLTNWDQGLKKAEADMMRAKD